MNSEVNALQSHRWAPHVTVATVVERDGKVLLVEEHKVRGLVLNQPAGHLEPGETLAEAAVRETREESGWEVEITGLIGTYQWTAPDGKAFLRFAFAARPLAHHPDQPLDTGITQALWLTPTELQQSERLRSPLVWQVVQDWLGGQLHPLNVLKALP